MKPLNCIDVLGKIGTRVYQRTAPGKGNISNGGRFDLQNRAHVAHANPNTPAQQAVRAKFRAGVAAWQAMPSEDKTYWKIEAHKIGLSGFNLFVSNHLKA